jgi:hypothetical protein
MTKQLDVQRLADILVATWVVSHGSGKSLPLAGDTLGSALKRAIQRGAFPTEFGSLRFAKTSVGYRMANLPDLVHQAQISGLVTSPNPYYQTGMVELSPERALAILDELGIGEADARRWGAILKEELSRAATSQVPDERSSS